LPLEKLLLKGTASHSDAELLSILISSGTPQENSLDIAQKIMASCQNNLCEFWKLGISDLQNVKGIGKQRACQIASMFALSRKRIVAHDAYYSFAYEGTMYFFGPGKPGLFLLSYLQNES
jgi:DNA repair protein RadC